MKEDHDILLSRYFSGEASELEQEELEKWLAESEENEKYFEKMTIIFQHSALIDPMPQPNVEKAIAIFNEHTKTRTNKTIVKKLLPYFSAAASLALIVVLSFGIFGSKESEIKLVAFEQTTNYNLCENTFITLEIQTEETHEFVSNISQVTNLDKIFTQKKLLSDNGNYSAGCRSDVITIKNEEMDKKSALMAALALSVSTPQLVAEQAEQQIEQETVVETRQNAAENSRAFQATFIYPIGTDGANSINNSYRFSLNILGGKTGKVNGAEIGSLFNINRYAANGVQIAGIFNFTGTNNSETLSRNTQIAGIYNHTRKGISQQIAGILNVADTATVQIAGIANLSRKSNVQISGITDISREANVQISGITSIADSSNVQISGIANIADKSSVQIGGIANITGKGGFQLGLINIRDTIDGISIGLVNIVRQNGLLEFEISGSEFLHAEAAFRSGSHRLYGIISAGYNFEDDFWAFGAGLGARFFPSSRVNLDVEAVHYNLHHRGRNYRNYYYQGLVQVRPIVNINLAGRFKVFLGPTFNLLLTREEENGRQFPVPYSIWNTTTTRYERDLNFWIGARAGLRF